MNFDLTQDQKLLVDTAASFAKKTSPVERLRKLRWTEPGWDPAMWKQMAELGWLGLPFAEEVGGYGGRFIDVCLLLEQLGTSLVPEPYLASVVLGGMAIARAGSKEQQQRWLGPFIEGKSIIALAWAERESRFDAGRLATTVSRGAGGKWRIDGDKVFVLAGHAADLLVVSARAPEGGVSLFAVDAGAPGVTVRSIKTMDGHRAAMVELRGVEVGDDRLLGAPGGGLAALEAVLDLGAAACVAEGLGIQQRVLDMTVDYLKTRVQFDVVIGSFQVLQHRAVDMFVQVETSRSMTILAGLRADGDDVEERARAVSAAKVQLCTGGRFVTAQGIQLHGGIGITDEHDIGLYFKRMQVLATLCGDEEHHLARFASLPGFTEGAA
ncbi:MAG TPA: acyl-CoA dehydrogenase family protein [Kofleriaceae bacterium]|nr:acyl-CoA dehydrogenase family protein [Kofleriaceae bacterium]